MKTAQELLAQWEAQELNSQQKYKDEASRLVKRLEESGDRSIPLVALIHEQTAEVLKKAGYTVKMPTPGFDQREGDSWVNAGSLSF